MKVGDQLPVLRKAAITTTQLVKYAGAALDFNRIHYEDAFAKAAGFPSVIAHGMLSLGFFGQLLTDWVGDPAAIVALSARFRAVTLVGDEITVSGEVTKIEGERVEVKLAAKKSDGTLTLEGAATLRLTTYPSA
jgi:acyl dehydratase